jgi:hypothetical protein
VALADALELALSKLAQCWWWRRIDVVVVVLIGTTVASVGHLMIMKRFETEIDIEIRDSQLYVSRYTND